MEDFDKRLLGVVRIVFGKDVSFDARREDEPAWDSLNHLKLIMAFESEFGIRIPVVRIDAIRTLREFGEFV